MKKLVEILKEETKSLKFQYIKMTKEWAKKEFENIKNLTEQDIKDSRGFKNASGRMEHTTSSYNYWVNLTKTISKGLEAFIANSVTNAEKHYESSILKLAKRILKKDLNIDQLKSETSHIGVNIETILTDGNKTVNAYTIIASGPVQKPHYRYLIK